MPTSLVCRYRKEPEAAGEYAAWGSPFDGGDGTHRKGGGAVSRITLDKVENLVKIAHSEKWEEV